MVSSHQPVVGTNTPEPIEVVPLTLHIGAEIRGVDLAQPLPPEQLKAVRDAFLKWKVIFFRDQNLDHAQHVAMARQFGEPTIGHAVFGHVEGHPEIYSVAKNRTANAKYEAMMVTPWFGWHTDVTAAVNPPCASILRGVTIPPYGGDTFWTNLVAAYAGLSEPMRAFVDGLRGIHAFEPRGDATAGSEYNERVKRRALKSEHPLVTVHAETGERVLFASPSFLKSVVGLLRGKVPRFSRSCGSTLFAPNTRCASNGTRVTSPSGTIGRPRTWRRGTFSNPTSIVSFIGSRWWANRWSASMASRPGPSKACRSDRRRRNCG